MSRVVLWTSVTDAADSPASSCSVETVYNAQLVNSGSQSRCTVSVIKLDWESVSNYDLTNIAASIDTIIATGNILTAVCKYMFTRLYVYT